MKGAENKAVKKPHYWNNFPGTLFNMQFVFFLCNTATILLLVFFTHSSEHYKPNKMMKPITETYYDKKGLLHSNSGKNHKVIFMLIDGMSYRFLSELGSKNIEGGKIQKTQTEGLKESNELKSRLSIFTQMKEKYPRKTILEPAFHRSPTWTIHGVKSLLTGFLPPESVKDMLFKEKKTYEILLDCLNQEKKSYFVGDVYWKDFIDQKT